MLEQIDPVLLAVGATRVAIWAAIAVVGYKQRRLLPLAFGALGALTRAVFAIENAHGDLASELTGAANFLAVPTAALILMFVLVTRPTLPAPTHGRMRGWYL